LVPAISLPFNQIQWPEKKAKNKNKKKTTIRCEESHTYSLYGKTNKKERKKERGGMIRGKTTLSSTLTTATRRRRKNNNN